MNSDNDEEERGLDDVSINSGDWDAMNEKDGTLWISVEKKQHIYAVNEFERQICGRINSKGWSGKKIVSYQMNGEDKAKSDTLLKAAMDQVPSIPNTLTWQRTNMDGGRRGQKRPKDSDNGPHTFECDFYMRLVNVDGNEPLNLKSILKDVSDRMVLLNSEDGSREDEEDVKLEKGDMIWMEIAETPQQLRNKLVQLERAFIHFKRVHRDECLPHVAVICLNGEEGLFWSAVNHLKQLYQDGKLTNWEIFNSDIRLFVTYTPYRNVYGTLQEIKQDMGKAKQDMDEKFAILTYGGFAVMTGGFAAMCAILLLKK